MKYSYVINPNNGEKYDVDSKEAKKLIKQYLKMI